MTTEYRIVIEEDDDGHDVGRLPALLGAAAKKCTDESLERMHKRWLYGLSYVPVRFTTTKQVRSVHLRADNSHPRAGCLCRRQFYCNLRLSI